MSSIPSTSGMHFVTEKEQSVSSVSRIAIHVHPTNKPFKLSAIS